MRIGSLFAGIGGFDLAARWMGWETAWFSEIDPYASAVLAKHWPGVPNHGDITQIDFTQVEPVDMLCGGFPCQPHSLAGKRKASADERDLWGEYERAIRILRPRYVVAENVPGLLSSERGAFFARVLSGLASLRYDAEWTVFAGSEVGAPHARERVWIVAYPQSDGASERRERTRRAIADGRGAIVGDSDCILVEGERPLRIEEPPIRRGNCAPQGAGHGAGEHGPTQPRMVRATDGLPDRVDSHRWPARQGEAQHDWEPPRVATPTPYRRERIHSLGNAIVPQCAYEIFCAIERAEAVRSAA